MCWRRLRHLAGVPRKQVLPHTLPAHTLPLPPHICSPAAQVDMRGELSSLLRSHQYEQAFSRALGLQDVATVGWLCTQVSIVAQQVLCATCQCGLAPKCL